MTTTYQRQPDILCFSHLRWDFVFQRPQHLMSRFARDRQVYYVEEPLFDSARPLLRTRVCPRTSVIVVTPHLRQSRNVNRTLESLLAEFVVQNNLTSALLWYYTPMALEFVPSNIKPAAIVYDCMDELSKFRGAPPQLQLLEQRLMREADLVFTGGVSLYEAKRRHHTHIHPFPSGVDSLHFMAARNLDGEHKEQQGMARPRLGYAGVIDERMNLELLAEAAALKPDWQWVMIGPTAKIAPDSLPRAQNIHWLGMKDYNELPQYFAGWDVAVMPFAMNESTQFISPTKTPEFLAAGLPVVSTPVRDVVRPYGDLGLVRIASTAGEFVDAAERELNIGMTMKWRERADAYLRTLSWDVIWKRMNQMMAENLRPEKTLAAGSASLAQSGPGAARV